MNTLLHTSLESIPVISPEDLRSQLPLQELSANTIQYTRSAIRNILSGRDDRLIVITGPCSIHDPDAAMDYAYRLQQLSKRVSDRLLLIMRVYLEKPRTSTGWKGLINDPHLDGSCELEEGLEIARKLLTDITTLGLGTGTEMLDPLLFPYFSDLISYTAIGARTTESQTHRQFASSLPLPVGFKNATDGSIEPAINAIISARNPHCFPGVDDSGRICIIRTNGNRSGHLILRGGKKGPNYDALSLSKAENLLLQNNLNPSILIDCSHMNAAKKHQNQAVVMKDSIVNLLNGYTCIRGLMIESNIYEGNQALVHGPLRYGVSITDECISWETTEELLLDTYEMLRTRSRATVL